jgi:isopenicillin N synthase-like dioxygenase
MIIILVDDMISFGCRVDLETYCEELRTLAIQILDLMAYSLAIDPAEIRELFDQATQSTRMNYYPPCPQPELVVGLNSHSDGGGLTILLQGNDVEGLQIKKDGLWIPVKPLPNAFIINLGDMLEVIINYCFLILTNNSLDQYVTIENV